MARNRRNGVVKQLSNLSIDEISLVDRGANQHALISIAKRAPEASDVFEEVEKFSPSAAWEKHKAGLRQNYEDHPKLAGAAGMPTGHGAGPTAGVYGANLAGGVAGGAIGAAIGHKVAGAEGAAAGGLVGSVAGGLGGGAAAGQVVHNHFYGETKKNLESAPMDVNDLFDVSKKKSSIVPKGSGSFGQGGNQAVLDTFTGNDPSGVTADPNGEDGDIGNGGTIDGIETIEGEDTPPQKGSKKAGSKNINPTPLSGLGKSADYWTDLIEKALDGDDVSKHFPGGGGGNPMNPQQSPFPGAQGAGAPPTMQTAGVQPMGMGQPQPPPMQQPGMPQPGMQPAGGMPQQLPPDVVQYIQQLEQALDQATGGQTDDSDGNDDSASQQSDPSSSNGKNNPFGKSGDFNMNDNLFLTELAKSLDDEDQREAVGKALEAVSKAEQRAIAAETIAKQERDLRLEREFVAKAAEFNTPVTPQVLGPVLKRLAESVTKDDFQTIVKCLNGASARDDIFAEVGKRGGGSNGSVLDEVNARAQEYIGKSLSPEQAVAEVFEMDPRAYDAYLSDHPSRRISR